MIRFILKRTFSSIIVLLVIITISLWLTRQAPSNPCLKEKQVNTCACVNANNLDEPVFPVYIEPAPFRDLKQCDIWEPETGVSVGPIRILGFSQWTETQYAHYLGLLAKGSLGESMKTDRQVLDIVGSALPYTLQLGMQAMLFALLLGIPAGLIAGLKQNTAVDHATMTFAMVGVSIPNFVLGPLLIMWFAMDLGWFRPNGWSTWWDSVLPTITLGLFYTAYIARLTRGGMLEIIRKDFIRTARAKGLAEKIVVLRHALKGAILPVVSYMGPAFAAMLTGSVVVEEIFSLPGVGTHFVRSALNRDYNLLLGTVILYSTLLVFLNFAVDILYTFIDPRVDYDD